MIRSKCGRHGQDWNSSELQFLPAALEIVETPPVPLGRAVYWTVMLLFVLAFVRSFFGKVDEVAIAPGRIVPVGYTKAVQVEDKGVIKSIHVKNGSVVRQGDILVELVSVTTEAERDKLLFERDHCLLELERLKAERDGSPFIPRCGTAQKIEEQRKLLNARRSEYESKASSIRQQSGRARAALDNALSQRRKYAEVLGIVGDQKKRAESLFEKDLISLFEYQSYQQKEAEMLHDLASQESMIRENRHAIEQSDAELKRLEEERLRDIAEKTVEAAKTLDIIEQELKKAEERDRLCRVVAPVDGVVQQMEVHTLGGVVLEAQQLMALVPVNAGLRFEVFVSNQDIAFVRSGQRAEIKVDAFSFQRYGTLEAEVEMLAAESEHDPEMGLVYRALLSADRSHFVIDGRSVDLLPGMTVNAELKIREKRIIDYFLDTFKKYRDESLRER